MREYDSMEVRVEIRGLLSYPYKIKRLNKTKATNLNRQMANRHENIRKYCDTISNNPYGQIAITKESVKIELNILISFLFSTS